MVNVIEQLVSQMVKMPTDFEILRWAAKVVDCVSECVLMDMGGKTDIK